MWLLLRESERRPSYVTSVYLILKERIRYGNRVPRKHLSSSPQPFASVFNRNRLLTNIINFMEALYG